MSADVEHAVRQWLRTHPAITPLIGARVFFGTPANTASCITVSEAGGAPEESGALDRPVLAFSCWASYDPAVPKAGTKAEARAIRDALVDALLDLQSVTVGDVCLLTATVLSAQWLPDLSTKPDTPRYVVDAEVRAVQLVS